MPRRLLALLACAVVLPLAACGGSTEEDGVLVGETEGTYIDIGEVKYQVQLSRILNPADPEDRPLLAGVPAEERELEQGETWFAIWVRAENLSDQSQPKVEEFAILDTLGEEFEPIELGPQTQSAWQQQPDLIPPVGPRNQIPIPDSPADQTSAQGALLLFKLEFGTLENRPLQLEIKSPTDPEVVGEVDLDV